MCRSPLLVSRRGGVAATARRSAVSTVLRALRLGLSAWRGLAAGDGYAIKPGYRANHAPKRYRCTPADELRYQVDVYRHAGAIARDDTVDSVLDLGCGLPAKLLEYVAPYCRSVVGVDDCAETIASCRNAYPKCEWIAADVEDPSLVLSGVFDLVIAADVIEHLHDPDRLLRLIARVSHPGTSVVLSTPERDSRRGAADMGPPANPAHVREWNAAEFRAYLESRNFRVRDARIVRLREGMWTCQLVMCEPPGTGA